MISNEKFGYFLTTIRKQKQLTQKELAVKLYVSDKTVSKWERGLSMPNVALLIPIADVLGVNVTELLKGEHINKNTNLQKEEVESLLTSSLDQSIHHTLKQKRKNWIYTYIISLVISSTLCCLLLQSGLRIEEIKDTILLLCGFSILFGGWFTFFAKELLPSYYDHNKINFFTQGLCRIHMVGISFNNTNWHSICTAIKLWSLSIAILIPLLTLIIITLFNKALCLPILTPLVWLSLLSMFITIYIVAKRYEA